MHWTWTGPSQKTSEWPLGPHEHSRRVGIVKSQVINSGVVLPITLYGLPQHGKTSFAMCIKVLKPLSKAIS